MLRAVFYLFPWLVRYLFLLPLPCSDASVSSHSCLTAPSSCNPRPTRHPCLFPQASPSAAPRLCARRYLQVLEAWTASLWQPLQAVLPIEAGDGIKAVATPTGLYGRLGGPDGVAAVFEGWLRKAGADWRVKRFLEAAQDPAAKALMVRVGLAAPVADRWGLANSTAQPHVRPVVGHWRQPLTVHSPAPPHQSLPFRASGCLQRWVARCRTVALPPRQCTRCWPRSGG